ncbi:MAG: hypothetical protein L0H73_10165 [Nitrococcus sp.]|nr:hypothetical protein [Nitrococcus sp.]
MYEAVEGCDSRQGRVLTIQQLESLVTEFVTAEQGMMIQNIALMVQAMGLGGGRIGPPTPSAGSRRSAAAWER